MFRIKRLKEFLKKNVIIVSCVGLFAIGIVAIIFYFNMNKEVLSFESGGDSLVLQKEKELNDEVEKSKKADEAKKKQELEEKKKAEAEKKKKADEAKAKKKTKQNKNKTQVNPTQPINPTPPKSNNSVSKPKTTTKPKAKPKATKPKAPKKPKAKPKVTKPKAVLNTGVYSSRSLAQAQINTYRAAGGKGGSIVEIKVSGKTKYKVVK